MQPELKEDVSGINRVRSAGLETYWYISLAALQERTPLGIMF